MQRFTVPFIVAAIAAVVYLPRGEDGSERNADTKAAALDAGSASAASSENGQSAAPSPVADESARSAQFLEATKLAWTEDAAAPGLPGPDSDPETTAELIGADEEALEASHITASASAEEIGEELNRLSLFDLKAATQEQLARVGCYKAKIDGLWGPKSRAALSQFNDRTGNTLDGPGVEVIEALKAVPAGFCAADTVASTNTGGEESEADHSGADYLPPWMRGQKVASTEPDRLTDGAAATVTRSEPKRYTRQRAKPRRTVRKRVYKVRRRAAQRRDWRPDNWPGSN